MVYQQPSKKPASDDTTYFSKSSQKEQQESFGGNFAPNQSDERLNGQSLPEYSSRGWDLLKAKFARTRPKDGIQGNQESSEQPEAKLPLQTDQNSESALSNSDSSKNLEKQVFPADENKALAFKQTNSAHSSTLISQANQSVQPSETEFRFQLILPPDVIQKIQQKQLYGKNLRDELLVLLFMQLEGKSRNLAELLVSNKLWDWSFYREPKEEELEKGVMSVSIINQFPVQASQTGSQAGIQKQNSERDAQELRQALQQGSKTEQTVIRILNQPPQIVQQILEIYNSQYNTLSGKGLFVDIKIKLSAIDSEGLERYWEFVVAQFQLAGIYIPPYILQNEKLEKLEYYRQNDTNNNKHFEIVAEPKNTIAATQTQITYFVQVLRDEVFDKKPNYQYQWYILNDPETVKNNPNVPARYYHEANVGSRWENAEWKYPGNHKVICRVQVNDRPPVYIEYQQTVLPREVVLDESLKKAPIPPDPSQQSILLKNYQKALLNAEQQKGSNSLDPKVKEQLQAQNDELDKKLKSTDGLKRHPIKAIYLSKQGAKTFPLNVFVAQTEDRLGSPWAGRYTWTLVDITNPTDQRMSGEYSGMGHTHQEAIQAAINKWNQNNRYYPGIIKLEVAEAVAGQVIQSEFETDGKNFWDSLSQFLDVIGFVTGIASILTFAIPVLSIPLASVSIAASTAGATIRLVQRRVEERPDPVADTLDILTIVSNVFAGVWLRGANARLNGTASTNFNNGILIGQLAADGGTGVILNTVYLKRYEEIIQIKDPQERADKLIKLFQEAALSNGLLSLSITSTVKDIDAINRMRNSRETVEIDPSFVENPGTTSGALGIDSLPQPLINVILIKGKGISLQDLQRLMDTVVASGVRLQDLQQILDNIKDVLAGDNLLNSRNFLEGLAEAGNRQVRDYNLILAVLKTKGERYKDVINALCYTSYKVRWQYFDIIFDAKYRDIHLSVPRGFENEAQFRDFSQDIRQMLGGEFGDDIRVQGSSLMDLPGKPKDVDLAIIMNEQDYLKTLKKVFVGEYFRFKTGNTRDKMPANYDQTVADEEFLEFIDYVRENPLDRPKVNSAMTSVPRAWDNGKLADSKFLTNQQISERNGIIDKYGFNDMDLSIISTNKGFESGPFLQLLK